MHRRYHKQFVVGSGVLGRVYKAVDTETGQDVAIKVIDLEDVEDTLDVVTREVDALTRVRCPQVVEYSSSFLTPGTSQLNVVMQLMACSARDMLSRRRLDEPAIAYVVAEVLRGLVYLHRSGIVHRDVKAANVLAAVNGDVRLTDFSASRLISDHIQDRMRTAAGTPFWMAPEVILSGRTDGYTKQADVWSLGITAYELAVGHAPHQNKGDLFLAVQRIVNEAAPRLEGRFSDALKDFVAQCLQKDPDQRPTADELLRHRFVAQAQCPAAFPSAVADTREWLYREAERAAPEEYAVAGGHAATNWDWSLPGASAQVQPVTLAEARGAGLARQESMPAHDPFAESFFGEGSRVSRAAASRDDEAGPDEDENVRRLLDVIHGSEPLPGAAGPVFAAMQYAAASVVRANPELGGVLTWYDEVLGMMLSIENAAPGTLDFFSSVLVERLAQGGRAGAEKSHEALDALARGRGDGGRGSADREAFGGARADPSELVDKLGVLGAHLVAKWGGSVLSDIARENKDAFGRDG